MKNLNNDLLLKREVFSLGLKMSMRITRSMAKKTAYYDFSIGEERQRFSEDTYKYAMTWCDFDLADYIYNPISKIFYVKNGPHFLATLSKMWHDKVRLIPVSDFLVKYKGLEYFQFKSHGICLGFSNGKEFTWEMYPKIYEEKITFDLEDYVMTTLEKWVLSGKYIIPLSEPISYSFHAHCLELLYRGIHYVPKTYSVEGKTLELEILNYYGPSDPIYHA